MFWRNYHLIKHFRMKIWRCGKFILKVVSGIYRIIDYCFFRQAVQFEVLVWKRVAMQWSHAWLSIFGRKLFPSECEENSSYAPASWRRTKSDRSTAWPSAEDEYFAVSCTLNFAVTCGILNVSVSPFNCSTKKWIPEVWTTFWNTWGCSANGSFCRTSPNTFWRII